MKQKFQTFFSVTEKFFSSDLFIYLCAIFTLIISSLSFVFTKININAYTTSFWLIIISLIYFTQKNVKACIPAFIFILFSLNTVTAVFNVNALLIISAVIFVASVIFNMVYFKPILKPTKTIKTSIFLGIALGLGGITLKQAYTQNGIFINLTILAIFAIVFFLMTHLTSSAKIDGAYIMKVLVLLGVTVMLQSILSVAFFKEYWIELYTLGWGNYNGVIIAYQFALPAMIYFVFKSEKYNYLFVILANILCLSIVLTESRTGMGLFLVQLVAMDIFFIIKFRKVKKIFITTVSVVGFLFVAGCAILIVMPEVFTTIFYRFIHEGLHLNGRNLVWNFSKQYFFEHPLFGVSIFHGYYGMPDWGIVFFNSHNIVLQMLSSTGIVGLIAYFLHAVYKFKLSLKPTVFHLLTFIMFAFSGLFGFIDVTFPNPVYIVLVYVTMLSIELVNANTQTEQKPLY